MESSKDITLISLEEPHWEQVGCGAFVYIVINKSGLIQWHLTIVALSTLV